MTDLSLSHLPMTAGATLAGSLGRGGVWALNRALDLGLWGIGQFMRAPLAISAAALVVGLSIAAGGNALYFQSGRHPAPLFYPAPRAQVAEHRPAAVAPVIPAPRPHLQPAVDEQTTGSVAGEADAVDSRDVLALQQKLVALKLLSDDPDGLFGKRTATAIKAFEARAGMKADGRLTPAAIAAIMAAPLPAPVAQPQIAAPAPAPQRLPAAQPLPPAAPVVASAAAAPIAMAPIAQPASTAAAGRAQGTGPRAAGAVAPRQLRRPSPRHRRRPSLPPWRRQRPRPTPSPPIRCPMRPSRPTPADATVALPTPAPDTAGNVSAVAMTAPSIAPAPRCDPPGIPGRAHPGAKARRADGHVAARGDAGQHDRAGRRRGRIWTVRPTRR